VNEQFFVFCLLRVIFITGFIGPQEI
jgi:hypothetical protein